MVIDDDLFCGLSWNWERIALGNLMAHINIYRLKCRSSKVG
jgi:hypothetical protein